MNSRWHGGEGAGFTLIELILVTAIMLALVGLSVPLFKRTFSDLTIKNASFNISKLINYAQESAILERKNLKLALDFQNGRYRLFEIDPAAEPSEKPLGGRFGRSFKLPRGISFKSSKSYVMFYPDGRCDEINIDVFDKALKGYKIRSKGFGSRIEIKEIEDAG